MRNKTVIVTAVICAALFVVSVVIVLVQFVSRNTGAKEIILDGETRSSLLYNSTAGITGRHFSSRNTGEIEIILGGETIYRGSATREGEPLYIDATRNGITNHIRIDEKGVLVESANCANQVCVKMGYLRYRYLPIVCQPSGLVICYCGYDTADEVDGISQ